MKIKVERYTTHPIIKDEMLKLLVWARDNDIHQLHETPEQKLEEYLKYRDVAIEANNVKIIEKVSTRNAFKETMVLTACLLGGILIAAGIGIAIQIYGK